MRSQESSFFSHESSIAFSASVTNLLLESCAIIDGACVLGCVYTVSVNLAPLGTDVAIVNPLSFITLPVVSLNTAILLATIVPVGATLVLSAIVIFAVPSKETPFIVLTLASFVAAAAVAVLPK